MASLVLVASPSSFTLGGSSPSGSTMCKRGRRLDLKISEAGTVLDQGMSMVSPAGVQIVTSFEVHFEVKG